MLEGTEPNISKKNRDAQYDVDNSSGRDSLQGQLLQVQIQQQLNPLGVLQHSKWHQDLQGIINSFPNRGFNILETYQT